MIGPCSSSAGARRASSPSASASSSRPASSRCSARRSFRFRRSSRPTSRSLYLRLDFVGSVVFDPLRIAFDAKLIHSRIALIQHHRPVRVPRPVRRSADVSDQRRRLPSALQGNSVRHSGPVRPRRRQPRHRHRRHRASEAISRSLGDDPGRRGAACLGRHRHRQHRRRFRLRRDLLSGAEVLFRARHLRVSRRARVRHRLRVDPSRRTLAGPGPLAHRRQRARSIRRGRCPISRSTSTSAGAPIATRRRSRSTSPSELAKEISSARTGARSCRKAVNGFLTLADIKAGTDVLAHPLGTLVFQQKLVPFELRMAKASGSKIERRERVLGAGVASIAGRPSSCRRRSRRSAQ